MPRSRKPATCHPDRPNASQGLCWSCLFKKYPERRPRYKRAERLKLYGLTLETYDLLLKAQGSVCAICKQPSLAKPHLSVDHNHLTGKVRGLLCVKCNAGLGSFGDNIEMLAKAIAYLKERD